MADTIRDESAILTLFQDNTVGAISAQDLRDFVVSVRNLGRTGWANYQDNAHTSLATSQTLSAGVKTLITNDTLNPGTDETHIPYDTASTGIGSWWDPVTNKFLPTNLHDAYDLRFSCTMQTATASSWVTLTFDIGGTIGAIWSHTYTLPKGANTPAAYTASIPLFVGTTFISNGGSFYATAQDNSNLWNMQLVVIRNYAA